MTLHPNSLANLKPNREGSKPRHGSRKKRHNVTVTADAWGKVKKELKENHNLSVSEFIEQLGRGRFKLVEVKE